MRIITGIREKSVGHYGFVRHDPRSGRYIWLGDMAARTIVGQGFRDLDPRRMTKGKEAKMKLVEGFQQPTSFNSQGSAQESGATVTSLPCPNGQQPQTLLDLLSSLPLSEDPDDDPFEPTPIGPILTGPTQDTTPPQPMPVSRNSSQNMIPFETIPLDQAQDMDSLEPIPIDPPLDMELFEPTPIHPMHDVNPFEPIPLHNLL